MAPDELIHNYLLRARQIFNSVQIPDHFDHIC